MSPLPQSSARELQVEHLIPTLCVLPLKRDVVWLSRCDTRQV